MHQQKTLVLFGNMGKRCFIFCKWLQDRSASMGVFHFSAIRIGGNGERSSVGASAYHSGTKMRNETDGVTHDYTKRRGADGAAAYHSGSKLNEHDYSLKSEIAHSEIMLPKHAPAEFSVRATLWNSVESAKKQHNEQTARMIVVALPNELTTEQNIELVRNFVRENFVDDGMCADFSIHLGHIHERKDEVYPFKDSTIQKENPHAHIQLTTRPLSADGTWSAKSKKEYILDKNGKRIKLPSGAWKSRRVDLTNWEKPETLLKWRENWANAVNKEYERLGIDERIDHRSLKAQGIDREPTKHMGHKAWNMEKKGVKTIIGNQNRAIMERNKERTPSQTPEKTAANIHELKEDYIAVEKKLTAIQHEVNAIEHNQRIAQLKAEEIEERAEYIKTLKNRINELEVQRKGMGILARNKDKKEVEEQIKTTERSHERAVEYFERTHKIAPTGASNEIKRLVISVRNMHQTKERLRAKLSPLLEDKIAVAKEYHKQKLIAEISRDRERIRRRLERLEKEIEGNLAVKDKLMRGKILESLEEGMVKKENDREIPRIRTQYRSR